MSAAVFFRRGHYEVTDTLLRTARKTYALSRIEYVSVQRPLLLFLAPPVFGLLCFAGVFRRYLYAGEIVTLLVVCAAAGAAALLFGTLRVHSIALRDEDVASSFGLVTTLRQVRLAVEQAMAHRRHGQIEE